MAASGTFGYGVEFAKRCNVSTIGGIVCKGITVKPRAGHPPPRIVETAGGALNAIGLANIGLDAILADLAPNCGTECRRRLLSILAASQSRNTSRWQPHSTKLPEYRASRSTFLPDNVGKGGMLFGADPTLSAEVTKAVRASTQAPLIVKLTPNTEPIAEVAVAVADAGAEALTVANTYLGMVIDAKTRRATLTNTTGGLSGPAIKPLTLRLVYEVARRVKIPIIGCGGIMNGTDAVEYLLAGATAVQAGTVSLVDPFALPRIATELEAWKRENRVADLRDIIGAALPHP